MGRVSTRPTYPSLSCTDLQASESGAMRYAVSGRSSTLPSLTIHQQTRSREQNRTIARRQLRERVRCEQTVLLADGRLTHTCTFKLDMYMNPGSSQRDLKAQSIASKKAAKKRKHNRKKRDKEASVAAAKTEEIEAACEESDSSLAEEAPKKVAKPPLT